MGSSLRDWVTLALNLLVILVFLPAYLLVIEAAVKSRTWLTVWRSSLHLSLPFITVMFLINGGWRLALMPLLVWTLFLAATHPYVVRIERPAERANSVESATLGEKPVMYLRSFAAAEAMRGIENLLEMSASSYAPSDDMHFQFNDVALGRDDRAGFPKLDTPDSEWWQKFEDIAEKSVAIFLLPIVAHTDPEAGIVRETAYVFLRHTEKLIVVVPGSETWQRFLSDSGESFDPTTGWNKVRETLRSVGYLKSIPEYRPSGFVFYMVHSGPSEWTCHDLELSTTGIHAALSEVTRKSRQESKRAWKNFEAEFKALNGMSYHEYYSRPGKKLPQRLPL